MALSNAFGNLTATAFIGYNGSFKRFREPNCHERVREAFTRVPGTMSWGPPSNGYGISMRLPHDEQ